MDFATTHYISDNVYQLGTLGCAVCGHHFGTETSAAQSNVCTNCGAVHKPGTFSALTHAQRLHKSHGGCGALTTSSNVGSCRYNVSAALFFTGDEIDAARSRVESVLVKSSTNYAADYCVGQMARVSCSGSGDAETSALLRRRVDARRAGTTEVDNRVIEQAFCEQCGKHQPCKSFARQTRSADEGQTIFYQCTVCASEWQHNS